HYCLTDVCRTVLHPFPTRRASDLGARVPVTSPSSVLGVSHSGQHLTGRRASRPALLYADSGIGPVRGLSLCLMTLGLSERGSTLDRKSTRLNSSHVKISYAVFCLK